MRADAVVTRAGVFVYRNPDGTERRELRHPDDVFDPASLSTLSMVPVTDGHPSALLDSDNARSLSVGYLGETVERVDGDLVRAPLLLLDAPVIEAVKRGDRRELSCGYDADVVEEVGEYDGEPYTHRQKEIRYNHVAVVPQGRAGPLVRMRIDGKEQWTKPADGAVQVRVVRADSKADVSVKASAESTAKGVMKMAKTKVRHDGVTIELEEEQAQVLEMMLEKLEEKAGADAEARKTLDAKLKDALAKLTDAEAGKESADEEAEKAKAEADTEKARADRLDAELKAARDPAAFTARINSRVALVAQATPVLGPDAKFDAMTDGEIRKSVAEKLTGEKFDGKGDVYVEARFDAEIARFDAGAQALGAVRAAAHRADSGAATTNFDAADKAFKEANQKAWQTRL